ncbi:MAG TPA: hypothetical protein PK357_02605 [Candidatus Pacearchaeota archaeon]|nr:hypothetical protein [Candidatus Pacearchaeota archaeon]
MVKRKERLKDLKNIAKKKTIEKKTINILNEDSKKLNFNFNLITGIMIFVLLIGASFSMSVIFGIAFSLCFIISLYNKNLKNMPFLPLIIFLLGILIRVIFILGFPSIFKSIIYLDLTISLLILIISFSISFKIGKK